jgi:hypothetical protein
MLRTCWCDNFIVYDAFREWGMTNLQFCKFNNLRAQGLQHCARLVWSLDVSKVRFFKCGLIFLQTYLLLT